MMPIIGLALTMLLSYCLGAIPSGYYIGRLRGVDIRQVGSGNIGATNVVRSMGKGWGALVLAMDFAKGLLAATAIPLAIGRLARVPPTVEWYLAGGVAAVVGHDWPVWLRFQGGKGIATSFGAMLGWMPLLALYSALAWALVFVTTRYVSLASLTAIFLLPLALLMHGRSLSWVVAGIALCLMGTYRHQANISRLLLGQEHRFVRK